MLGMNGIIFIINAHGVLRWMGAVTEIPGSVCKYHVTTLLYKGSIEGRLNACIYNKRIPLVGLETIPD